ncbi:MAG: hypothetical protein KGL53_15030, partial [Elusimicrobia bacterium]|nr:hypothetical protein [Elusimicrobiota bacterium]
LRTVRTSDLDAFRLLKVGRPMGKIGALSWLDDTLLPFLQGRRNEALRSDPSLGAYARQVFAGTYLQARPALFEKAYAAGLSAELAKRAAEPMDLAGLAAAHRVVMLELVGGARTGVGLPALQAEAIDRSPLPAATKRELLEAVFLRGYDEAGKVDGLTGEWAGDWLGTGDVSRTVAEVLIKDGVVSGHLDLFSRLLSQDAFRQNAKAGGWSDYASAVGVYKADLLGELERALAAAGSDAAKAEALQAFLRAVVDPAEGDYPAVGTVNTPELRDIKAKAVALAGGLDVPFQTRLALFRSLTGSGATPATDAFFRERLEPGFDAAAAAAAGLPLPAILESGRIAGSGLQLELAQDVLEPEVRRMEERGADAESLNRFVETLNAYVRQGSLKKDEYLESLAWRLDLSGKELGAFIEDEKSYNWRKADPLLLRFGSGLASEIAKLSGRTRADFIAFLVRPEGRELPAPILKELQRNAYQAALELDAG